MATPLFNVSASPLLATAPTLGTAQSFVALGGETVTNTGSSTINGDLGVWSGSAITGFPPGIVSAPYAIHTSDAKAQQAQADVTAAFNALGIESGADLTGQDLGGRPLPLTPGVYSFSSSAQLTGDLTLDAGGDPNAVFIFVIGTTLTTGSESLVNLINGGSACNVFWRVGSSATLGTFTTFLGNVLASESITLTTGASISPGRALAIKGALTLDSNTIDGSACISSVPPTAIPTNAPTNIATTGPTASPTGAATATATEEVTQETTPVPGLPGTGGGAPIRDESFPWTLAMVVGISAISLIFGVRAYARPK